MKKYLVDTHSVRKGLVSLAALSIGASIAIAQEPAKVSVYGFAQLNAVWEDGVISNTGTNWSYSAPKGNDKGGSRTLINVNHSRLGVNFSGPKNEGDPTLSGKLETDFNGNANRNNNGVGNPAGGGFRIRHSFGQVRFDDLGLILLFGQTTDVISPRDPAVLSEGTNNQSGNIGTRRPQIRITKELGPAEIAVAATDDRGSSSPESPAVQGRLGAKVSGYEIGVSGHLAKEKTSDFDEGKSYVKVPKSWSINADALLPVLDILSISGEFFYGQNLISYSSGSIGQTSDAAAKSKDDGSKYGIKSLGGWANLGLKLPANVAFNGGVGVESISNDDELVDGAKKSNLSIYSNLRYYFIKEAFVGIEYWRINTDYTKKGDDKTSGSINRVELAFQYAFK
jgi:hypothetical protein